MGRRCGPPRQTLGRNAAKGEAGGAEKCADSCYLSQPLQKTSNCK